MSVFKPKPRRQLRNDIYSLLLLLAVPAALLPVFPFSAIGYEAASGGFASASAACAFVRLDARAERAALAAARAAWQHGTGNIRSLRADLSAGALPSAPVVDVIRGRTRRAYSPGSELYRPSLLPPSLAAPPPARIAVESDTAPEAAAFPREELLKLD
jgi:hypothetical protein